MIDLINAIAVGLASTCLTIVAVHAGLAPFATKIYVNTESKSVDFKMDGLGRSILMNTMYLVHDAPQYAQHFPS